MIRTSFRQVSGTVSLAARTTRRACRRTVARSTALRILAVIAGFGAALLPAWLRWLPLALLAIPGPLDELAFVLLAAGVIACRPALRRQLAASLRLAVGARHLTAANEYVIRAA